MKNLTTVADKMAELSQVEEMIDQLTDQKQVKSASKQRNKLKVQLQPAFEEIKIIRSINSYIIKRLRATSQMKDETQHLSVLEKLYSYVKEQYNAYRLIMKFIYNEGYGIEEEEVDLQNDFDDIYETLNLMDDSLKAARQQQKVLPTFMFKVYNIGLTRLQNKLLAIALKMVSLQPVSNPYYIAEKLAFLPNQNNNQLLKACQSLCLTINKAQKALKKEQNGPGFIEYLLAGSATANLGSQIAMQKDFRAEDFSAIRMHQNRLKQIYRETEEARKETLSLFALWSAKIEN